MNRTTCTIVGMERVPCSLCYGCSVAILEEAESEAIAIAYKIDYALALSKATGFVVELAGIRETGFDA